MSCRSIKPGIMYNLKMAWRYLLKDRSFTVLNLLGLSTGLACAIMIFLWVDNEWRIDRFNKLDSRLFQVLKNSPSPQGITTDERTPGLLAATLANKMPEVEYATSVIPVSWFDKRGLLIYGDRRIEANEQFAGQDYFRMFSYRLIAGNKDDVLQDKNSIVISDDLALKLFHTTANVVGKTVGWNQKDYSGLYRISGIFEKAPSDATAQFDLVLNYSLFLDKKPNLASWDYNDPSTYVLLKKGVDIKAFNEKIAGLIRERVEKSTITLWAQKYSDRYLHNHYENGAPAGGRIEYVQMFSLIAVFILVIACINFMNLSTAKSAGRVKETGILKVVGASRSSLVLQYMLESMALSSLALILALGAVFLLLPPFNQITGKQLTLHFTPGSILTILAITLITGLVAGSYPALYLSGFKPAVILRSKVKNSVSELVVRKGLVLFQFTLSAMFIVSVLALYRQMQLIQTKNLGYSRSNLLYFDRGGMVSDNKEDYLPGGKYETDLQNFLNRVRSVPGVINAANFRHNITERDGGTYDISWPGKDPNTRVDFTDLDVGYAYIETAGITLKEGRTYSRDFGNEKANVIFNETAIEVMGLENPIGKVVKLWGADRTIVGVVRDFNFQSLRNNIKPCFFDLSDNQWASKIMVRVDGEDQAGTIDRLAHLYKEYNREGTFEYRYLDQDYQALYAAERRVASLSRYFAGVAVVISCLGLVGLAAFTAQKRQREIGIRKVMGATVNSILVLLSKDYLILILVAMLIGFPLAWWAMNDWLQAFVYRVDLGAGLFFLTGIFIVLMALLAIGFQSLKAASASPVKSLRSE